MHRGVDLNRDEYSPGALRGVPAEGVAENAAAVGCGAQGAGRSGRRQGEASPSTKYTSIGCFVESPKASAYLTHLQRWLIYLIISM
ncbi:MAG: hypothetical protein GX801_01610 [Fibrobacter sp.]|nr:hypothetical protein [Fibrobacter sp.]